MTSLYNKLFNKQYPVFGLRVIKYHKNKRYFIQARNVQKGVENSKLFIQYQW